MTWTAMPYLEQRYLPNRRARNALLLLLQGYLLQRYRLPRLLVSPLVHHAVGPLANLLDLLVLVHGGVDPRGWLGRVLAAGSAPISRWLAGLRLRGYSSASVVINRKTPREGTLFLFRRPIRRILARPIQSRFDLGRRTSAAASRDRSVSAARALGRSCSSPRGVLLPSLSSSEWRDPGGGGQSMTQKISTAWWSEAARRFEISE